MAQFIVRSMSDAERKAAESLFGQQFTPSNTVSGVLSDMLRNWPELLSRLNKATADAQEYRRLCRDLAHHHAQAERHREAYERAAAALRDL